jgi:TrmH family RNA methyltransferase
MASRNEIKLIKSLKIKKYRLKENKFLVEGIKNVTEVLHSGFKVHNLFVTEKAVESFNKYDAELISEKQLNEMSALKTNSSCLAVVEMQANKELSYRADEHMFLLDGVSDPGNLGTIIRTLDWFGFNQLFCSEDCADFYNPKTIASSMGSFTRVIPQYVHLISLLKKKSAPCYGMSMEGEPLSILSESVPSIFVLGSESHGISADIRSFIDHSVTIKGSGRSESLNVAIACSILCYQLSL